MLDELNYRFSHLTHKSLNRLFFQIDIAGNMFYSLTVFLKETLLSKIYNNLHLIYILKMIFCYVD